MDPVTIAGLIGSVVGIGDVVTRSIKRLSRLKNKFRDAPLLLSTLIGQLCTIQAALEQLSFWADKDYRRDRRYEKLAVQVGSALDCFRSLILSLQWRLDRFEGDAEHEIGLGRRMKFVWNESELTEYFDLLDRQVNALNLLLQAIQCKTWIEQDKVMSDEDSQLVLQHAKECMPPLVGLDNMSKNEANSILSDDTRAISVAFEFDPILMASQTYQAAHRSLFRQLVHSEKALRKGVKEYQDDRNEISQREPPQLAKAEIEPRTSPYPVAETTSPLANKKRLGLLGKHSNVANQKSAPESLKPSNAQPSWWKLSIARLNDTMGTNFLHDTKPKSFIESRTAEKKLKVLMLGAGRSGKSTLLKGLKILMEPRSAFSAQELLWWREVIFNNVIWSFHSVIAEMDESDISLGDSNNEQHKQSLLRFVESDLHNVHTGFPKLAPALESLWLDPEVQKCWREVGFGFDNLLYNMNNLHRLGGAEYVPSEEDVLRARLRTTGISETPFKKGPIEFSLFDVGGVRGERKKWIHVFDCVNLVIFMVDATGYDKIILEDRNGNSIQESLMLFECIVNSKYFERSGFILLFAQADMIHERLAHSSVRDHFPDCPAERDGHTSVIAYWQWLEKTFLNLVRGRHLSKGHLRILKTSLVDPNATGAEEVLRIIQDLLGLK
ncbi:MAG: hypothetical protein M1820_010067 [Bogoriella megaspora]|nr:MAG: hypothetical protein M1820_010067 [Bogoriella megaspora]